MTMTGPAAPQGNPAAPEYPPQPQSIMAAQPSASPAVRLHLDQQVDMITRLEMAINVHEDRLAPVLRPTPPQPGAPGLAGATTAQAQPTSAIADEVASRNAQIDALIYRLQRITDRIDV